MEQTKLRQLVEKTNHNDASEQDRMELRTYLETHPEAWKRIGDVSHAVRVHLLKSLNNGTLIETTYQGIRDLKERFGYRTAPPLEQLLIDDIILCWLQYQKVQYTYSDAMDTPVGLSAGAYWEKRLTAVQRRYLRSIETLARVRKLNLPAIQVNIGEQQVNVAG